MNPEYTIGWNHDSNGWWYADTTKTYYWNVRCTRQTVMECRSRPSFKQI